MKRATLILSIIMCTYTLLCSCMVSASYTEFMSDSFINGNLDVDGTTVLKDQLQINQGGNIVHVRPNYGTLVTGTNSGGAIYMGVGSGSAATPTGGVEASWGGALNPQISIGVTRDGARGNVLMDYFGDTYIRNGGNVLAKFTGSNGYVGIGTSGPTATLDVNGNVRIRGKANCDTVDIDASGNLVCGYDNPEGRVQWNDGLGRISIDGGGNNAAVAYADNAGFATRSASLTQHHDGNNGVNGNTHHQLTLGNNGAWDTNYNRLYLKRSDGSYGNEIHVNQADNAGTLDGIDSSGFDQSNTNEIQTLGTSGNTITLSRGGGSVTAPYSSRSEYSEMLNTLGGGHYVIADRYSGWSTRLYMSYADRAGRHNSVHVYYADNAGNANTVDGYHMNQDVTSGASPSFGTVRLNNDLYLGGSTEGSIYNADKVVGWNDLRLYGDSNSQGIHIGANGRVAIGGTSEPSEQLWVGGTTYINGQITASSFIYSSDESLKENIETIKNPKDLIMELRGVKFNWKEDGKSDYGFIAQEVEEVMPELISNNSEGVKGVKYGNIVAPLLEVVKDQEAAIEKLKEEVASLKEQIDN